MSELTTKDKGSNEAPQAAAPAPGATGIFGVLSSEPGPNTVAHETPAAPAPAPPARTAAPPIVVHEVKFQPEDSSGPGHSDPLQRLMQSPGVPSPPAEPMPAAAPPFTGGFTQLLSALEVPLSPPMPVHAPSTSEALGTHTPVAPHPVLSVSAPAAAFPEVPSALPSALPTEDEGSFTRLFEALAPAAPHEVPPRGAAVPPPTLQGRSTAEAIDPWPPSIPTTPEAPARPSSPAATNDPAVSFTQLFAALGDGPKPEPNQSSDYPPFQRDTPREMPRPVAQQAPVQPQFTHQSGASWPEMPPSMPLSGGVPRIDQGGDMSSLTQLLQALEQTSPASHGPVLPPRPVRASGGSGSGATVAFTPPESVQRLAAQPPVAQPGPGDFTRVLQASALRESGLGSQAAAPLRPAEPAPVSAAPAPAAAAPLPPWAAPPTPFLHQAPHLSATVGGGSVSLSPGAAPSVHLPSAPGAFVASPHAVPHLPHVPQGSVAGRPTWSLLPLILLAIIVILVGVVVALLLRH